MKHNFKPYYANVFIETGTYVGDGVKAASRAHFPRIISIELSKYYHELAKVNCAGLPGVELYYGDSVTVLKSLLPTINEQCTFWLDAHWCDKHAAGSLHDIPLMRELDIIAEHPIKNHIILIDGMRLLREGTREWQVDYTVRDAMKKILTINHKYYVRFGVGITRDDILIATMR